MPDEFKVVIAGLFDLAREKNRPPPTASPSTDLTAAAAGTSSAVEIGVDGPKFSSSDNVPPSTNASPEAEGAGGAAERPEDVGGRQGSTPASSSAENGAAGGGAGATATHVVAVEGATKQTTAQLPSQSSLPEPDGSEGLDSTALGGDERASWDAEAGEEEAVPPDWLTDPKAFVSGVLQWAEEGRAKRSRNVRVEPPKRVFPYLLHL